MILEPELAKLSKLTGGPFGRSESLSGASATTTSLHSRTVGSSSKPSSSYSNMRTPPLLVRNGRTYLRDDSGQCYPLPVDLQEVHRQSLRTLMLIQVLGTPYCALDQADRPPARILEVGCASGLWSMMCHRYLRSRGLGHVSFTGVDVVPMAVGAHGDAPKPDRDMKWRFVQVDIRQPPFPFEDDEFDHIMIKDMALATPATVYQFAMDEYLRILRPGGTIELWESDMTCRTLRPHMPAASADEDEEEARAAGLGVYVNGSQTSLSAPLNPFLVEYNGWIVRALEARHLTAVPCTLMGPMLLQEADALTDVRSRRMAVPLSEMRWEREGVGVAGVVTRDGKSCADWRGKPKPGAGGLSDRGGCGDGTDSDRRKDLSPEQLAIRHVALHTMAQQIQSLEPILREVSGKSQDEWDWWCSKMMTDLLRDGGTSWGECLETGAWWAKKR